MGGKLEEVNYQQIFTVACALFFSSSSSFILVICSSLHETWSLICCAFSPTAAEDYIGRSVLCNMLTKRREEGKKIIQGGCVSFPNKIWKTRAQLKLRNWS